MAQRIRIILAVIVTADTPSCYPADMPACACSQTRDGVHTLCALTFGTRQNWVQAVLTNTRPDLNREVKG